MISDRMSVSSRDLFVEGAHPSGPSRVVDKGAHLVDDFGFVRHEPEKRSGWGRRWWGARRVLVGISRGALDERPSRVERKLPDGGEELIDGRSGHEGKYTFKGAFRLHEGGAPNCCIGAAFLPQRRCLTQRAASPPPESGRTRTSSRSSPENIGTLLKPPRRARLSRWSWYLRDRWQQRLADVQMVSGDRREHRAPPTDRLHGRIRRAATRAGGSAVCEQCVSDDRRQLLGTLNGWDAGRV
jgi:hypothetical protein